MRPEENIAGIIKSVCPQSGHWPYRASAEIYIGYRPGVERLNCASGRAMSTEVEYDIVICAKRGAAEGRMEQMRYALYDALHAGGWRLANDPGPESYDRASELFMWPVTAMRRFYMDDARMPQEISVMRKAKEDMAYE